MEFCIMTNLLYFFSLSLPPSPLLARAHSFDTDYAAKCERFKSPTNLDDYKSSDQNSKDTHADQSNHRIKYKISKGDFALIGMISD